jgi:hypothetical protein
MQNRFHKLEVLARDFGKKRNGGDFVASGSDP